MSEVWIHGLAGSTSAIIAGALLHPFQAIRTRLQSSNQANSLHTYLLRLYHEKKLSSLYLGFNSTMINTITSYGVYFLVYRMIKKILESSKIPIGFLHDSISCAVSSAIVTSINTPLWTVNTIMMKQDSKIRSIFQCFQQIIGKEGISGLYKGFGSSLMLISNPIIQYSIYEFFKRTNKKQLSFWTYFVLGAISKLVATLCTFPLLTIRTRLQMAPKEQTIIETVSKLIENEGVLNLYNGFSSKVIHTVLNQAIILSTYEKLVKFLMMKLVKSPT